MKWWLCLVVLLAVPVAAQAPLALTPEETVMIKAATELLKVADLACQTLPQTKAAEDIVKQINGLLRAHGKGYDWSNGKVSAVK